MQWYYAINEQRLGPVAPDELERLVHAGTIEAGTLLWRQGMDDWQTLADLRAADPSLISRAAPPPLPDTSHSDGGRSGHSSVGATTDLESARADRLSGNVALSYTGPAVYAGFWRRAAAYLIDGIIWLMALQLVTTAIAARFFPKVLAVAERGFGYEPTPAEAIEVLKFYAIFFALGLAWSLAYNIFFLSRFSATPGKLMFGLRVVMADGEPLTVSRIIARQLAKVINGFTLGIGYLIAAFDEQSRGLHDYICNTRVIKKR